MRPSWIVPLVLISSLVVAGCEDVRRVTRPDTAALRLALAQETARRLDPVDAAAARVRGLRAGPEDLLDLKKSWRRALVALRQDAFPQAGGGLLFECLQAFEAVEADLAVGPTANRLRRCRARAAAMASAARDVRVAMAYARVERYAAAGLRTLGSRELARGDRDTGSALEREGRAPPPSDLEDAG